MCAFYQGIGRKTQKNVKKRMNIEKAVGTFLFLRNRLCTELTERHCLGAPYSWQRIKTFFTEWQDTWFVVLPSFENADKE